jgi:hypothetical protein
MDIIIQITYILISQRNLIIKKIQIAVVVVMSLLLMGCFREKIDSKPIPLNKDESFAMQVLKSGFHSLPFSISDANLPQSGYYDTLSYRAIHTLSLLANSGKTGLSRLGLVASGSTEKDLIHYVAWVPADDISIIDTDAINDFIHQHYLSPAVNAFISSDFNLKMRHPTKLVNNKSIELKVAGASCYPIKSGNENFDECKMFTSDNIVAVRYATLNSGIPFEPSIKANRYIVVRITGGFRSIGAIQHINSNMIYAYIPAKGNIEELKYLNRFSPSHNPIVSENLAYVIGKDRKVNYFAKIQK